MYWQLLYGCVVTKSAHTHTYVVWGGVGVVMAKINYHSHSHHIHSLTHSLTQSLNNNT